MYYYIKTRKYRTSIKTFLRFIFGCFHYRSPVGFTVFTIIIFGLGIMFSNELFENNLRIVVERLKPVAQGTYKFDFEVAHDDSNVEHIQQVFEWMGHKYNTKDWDLYWSYKFPFSVDYNTSELVHLKPNQKVNRFPGLGSITSKVALSMTNYSYMPTSFRIPAMIKNLKEYHRQNPEVKFLQKRNDHRDVMMKNIEEIDLNNNYSFVQVYMEDPLLVDGHKIDIGVFVIITSVKPLRVYIYEGDYPVRFCAGKYHPFDPKIVDKYVIGVDNYLPVWKMPSLSVYFNSLGFSSKDSFNSYMKSIGKDPNIIWKEIEKAIAEMFLMKEVVLNRVPNSTVMLDHSFWELIRFDFIVDEYFNIYMVEANAGPNLSSKTNPENAVLFDQVLYNLLSLVGTAQRVKLEYAERRSFADHMLSADRNIFINEDICEDNNCNNRCDTVECVLCRACLSDGMARLLHEAYREHINRLDCKRAFPPEMTGVDLDEDYLKKFSARNQIMMLWYNAKCKQDKSWCHR